jgi:hypothetical protein
LHRSRHAAALANVKPALRGGSKPRRAARRLSPGQRVLFVATDELEDKELKFLGWKSPKTGERLIDDSAREFKKSNGKS